MRFVLPMKPWFYGADGYLSHGVGHVSHMQTQQGRAEGLRWINVFLCCISTEGASRNRVAAAPNRDALNRDHEWRRRQAWLLQSIHTFVIDGPAFSRAWKFSGVTRSKTDPSGVPFLP